jgi:transposase
LAANEHVDARDEPAHDDTGENTIDRSARPVTDILQPQEQEVLRVLRQRPHWTMSDLADELSRARREPMTDSLLHTYLSKLRRKGIVIEKRTVYSLAPRR